MCACSVLLDLLPRRDGVKVTPDKFKSLVQLKCLRSIVEPGEAVGLLAAQVHTYVYRRQCASDSYWM